MFISCWNYPSWDDVPQEYKDHTLCFVDDVDGGMLVHCGYCGEVIKINSETQNCPLCNKDLIYPRADW